MEVLFPTIFLVLLGFVLLLNVITLKRNIELSPAAVHNQQIRQLGKLFVTRKRSFEPSRKVFTHSKVIVPGRVLFGFKAAVQAFFRFSVDE